LASIYRSLEIMFIKGEYMNALLSFKQMLKTACLAGVLALSLATSAMAQIGQVPLLTRSANADPNITLIMDDSGSMAADYIFQKGGTPGGYGMSGYGGVFDDQSPDFNKIYYDPRITYKPRLDRNFTSLASASTTGITSFNVYFHKGGGVDVTGANDPALATAYYTPGYTPSGFSVAYPNTVDNSVALLPKFPKRTDCIASATTCTFAEELQNYANWDKWHSTRLTAAATGIVKAFAQQDGSFRLGWGRINAPDNGSMTEIVTTVGVSNVYSTSTTGKYDTYSFASNSTIKKNGTGSYKNKVSQSYTAISGFTSGTVTVRLLEENSDPIDNATILGKSWDVDITIAGTKTNYKPADTAVYTQAVTFPIGSSNIKVDVNSVKNSSTAKKTYVFVTVSVPSTVVVSTVVGTTSGVTGTSTVVYTGEQNRLDSGVNAFTGAHRNNLVDWITGPKFNQLGSTPLVQALNSVGRYYMRKDDFGPWGDNPSTVVTKKAATSDSNQLACRRSYSILLTDGYWNGTSSVETTVPTTDTTTGATKVLGDIDGVDGNKITSTSGASYQYKATAPYKGPNGTDPSFTLADVAMHYWNTDLRPDLGNAVPTIPGINESFWQNMSLYTIAFGVYGTLPQTTTTLQNLSNGAQSWPIIKTSDNTGVDDLWHAAINGRGQMLSATNADELSDAIGGMFNQINKATASQSGVAASTLSLISGTKKFSPQYTTGIWTGNIIASELEPTTGDFKKLLWSVENINIDSTTVSSTIPASGSRSIVVWKDSASKAVDFTWANISGSTALNSLFTNGSADLVDYLRGVKTKEGPGNPYRARKAVLGDIVNSTPAFVKDSVNLSYDKLPVNVNSVATGQSTYKAYVATKQSRSDGVLFVGANDGMLHGFKESNGAEIFAYVPKAVLPNLALLSEKSYAHHYYVDGPLVETDAYSTGDSSWKNIIAGSTGAGAKAAFAIDVTNLSANKVLWEVDSTSTDFSDLGNVLTDIASGPVATGEWAAIFGNGPYSGTGKAVLYVVNIHTGALIRAIDTGVDGANGLGGVRLVRDASQKIVGVYAGDLKGNVWRFDLSSSTASSWSVSKMFTATDSGGNPKPITASVGIVAHPKGGSMVVVGTGKFYDQADMSTTQQQSMYGLWDPVAFGTVAGTATNTISGLSSLVQQTVSTVQITGTTSIVVTGTNTQTVGTQSVSYFTVSSNPIDYSTKSGWYIDMPNSGQRLVYPIEGLRNNLLRLDTIVPGAISNGCTAVGAGAAYNYILDAVTGSCNALQVLDADGDGKFDANDLNVCGYSTSPDGRDIALAFSTPPAGSNTAKGIFSLQSWQGNRILNAQTFCERNPTDTSCSPPSSGIQSRDWRQLFMR
jgi:type IV pilus assembly protein PilY1